MLPSAAMKTRAAQMLDRAGVRYEIHEFQAEELTAAEAAARLQIPPARVFKTLVARGDRTGVVLACVPATTSLSLKALAKASGNKKVEMVEKDEIQRLTGYIRGGVSPLGAKKPYPVYLDRAALAEPFLSVSAGMRGMQILLAPQDLIRVSQATVVAIGETDPESDT
jgi:Cys-tRNA(Pro)/Cys-tRNA(Cys) deacylase